MDSKKLVLWIREERIGAGEGGALMEVRGMGSASGSTEELSEPTGGGGGRSSGGGSLRMEPGETVE